MRQLWIAILAAIFIAGLPTGKAQAEKLEVKGVHLCCGSCVKAVEGILGKVDGVSAVTCDRTKKTITFEAKDEKARKEAVSALTDGGFYGEITSEKGEKLTAPAAPKSEKADEVAVKNVHVCCNSCKRAITALFKDEKVEFPAKNEVKISGKDLDKAKVVETLRKAGFNGKVD